MLFWPKAEISRKLRVSGPAVKISKKTYEYFNNIADNVFLLMKRKVLRNKDEIKYFMEIFRRGIKYL